MSTNPSEFEELKALVLENNKMLKGLERKARWLTWAGLIKWFVYIGIVIGLFAFLRPFYQQLINTYAGILDVTETINQGKNATSNQIQGFIDLIQGN